MGAAELVAITERIAACRDPTDDKFLELAINGRADLIVSGDCDLLALNPFRDISIVTPGATAWRQGPRQRAPRRCRGRRTPRPPARTPRNARDSVRAGRAACRCRIGNRWWPGKMGSAAAWSWRRYSGVLRNALSHICRSAPTPVSLDGSRLSGV
jgi:hypothetical protein